MRFWMQRNLMSWWKRRWNSSAMYIRPASPLASAVVHVDFLVLKSAYRSTAETGGGRRVNINADISQQLLNGFT